MHPQPDHAAPVGLLLMEYGEPTSLDEVAPYLTGHYGGRTPPPEDIAYLRERFLRVWGDTPPTPAPRRIAAALATALRQRHGTRYRVALGARYWTPTITAAMGMLVAEGVQTIIALPLSPHASQVGLRDYRRALEQAREQHPQLHTLTMIEQWHTSAGFLEAYTRQTQAALAGFAPDVPADLVAVFFAHSVPESSRKPEDLYREQLRAGSATVVAHTGLRSWRLAFHSAEPMGQWAGPDVVAILDELHAEGVRQVLYVPIGTVYENVELLYAIDVLAAQRAAELGMQIRRAALPNEDSALIGGLVELIDATTGRLEAE